MILLYMTIGVVIVLVALAIAKWGNLGDFERWEGYQYRRRDFFLSRAEHQRLHPLR